MTEAEPVHTRHWRGFVTALRVSSSNVLLLHRAQGAARVLVVELAFAHLVNVARSELACVDRLSRASNTPTPRIATLQRRSKDDCEIENSYPSNETTHIPSPIVSYHFENHAPFTCRTYVYTITPVVPYPVPHTHGTALCNVQPSPDGVGALIHLSDHGTEIDLTSCWLFIVLLRNAHTDPGACLVRTACNASR